MVCKNRFEILDFMCLRFYKLGPQSLLLGSWIILSLTQRCPGQRPDQIDLALSGTAVSLTWRSSHDNSVRVSARSAKRWILMFGGQMHKETIRDWRLFSTIISKKFRQTILSLFLYVYYCTYTSWATLIITSLKHMLRILLTVWDKY